MACIELPQVQHYKSTIDCSVAEQTADHVLIVCPIHQAPHGAQGLMVLDDETRCWLNSITAQYLIWAVQQPGVVKG